MSAKIAVVAPSEFALLPDSVVVGLGAFTVGSIELGAFGLSRKELRMLLSKFFSILVRPLPAAYYRLLCSDSCLVRNSSHDDFVIYPAVLASVRSSITS